MKLEWKTHYTSSHISNKVTLKIIIIATVYIEHLSVKHYPTMLSNIILFNDNNKNDINVYILEDVNCDYEHYMVCLPLNGGVVGNQPCSNSINSWIVVATPSATLFQA